jgi:hypothetical protein
LEGAAVVVELERGLPATSRSPDEGTRDVELSAIEKMRVAAALGFVAGYLLCGRKSRY